MKKALAHLPREKRRELCRLKEAILFYGPETEMIILFGSYARGDWVDDVYREGHITYEYRSDYDILVIVADRKGLKRTEHRVERACGRLANRSHATLIFHDIADVNEYLGEGHYFFTDIKREGVLLYDSGNCRLARRRKLDGGERARIARDDFRHWFTSASEFFDAYEFTLGKRKYKTAAFLLHQATERYYTAAYLVYTHYRPKLHDIERYGALVAGCDPAFLRVFPRATESEDECFKLLKRAYVDARYKRHSFHITRRQLLYLAERVAELKKLTRRLCRKKIAVLAEA